MSRSRNKTFWAKDRTKRHSYNSSKRMASKAVRAKLKNNNYDFPSKGTDYKKLYCSWNICDYRSIWSRQDAIDSWYEEESGCYAGCAWRHEEYKTLENWLNYWAICVERK